MKTNRFTSGLILGCLALFGETVWGQIPGGPYLGQSIPGAVPEPFATGIIPSVTPSITFTSDGSECFFTQWTPGNWFYLMTTKETNGIWPEPDTASFSLETDQSPHLTPDNNTLLFISSRLISGLPYQGLHLWFTNRIGSEWQDPEVMDSPIKEHLMVSAAAAENGNLYLSIIDDAPEIFVSRLINGFYQEPEKLSDSIHYLPRPMRPYIAPDESYLLFDASETQDPFSQRDLYISYRKPDQTWTKAAALSDTVNTEADETTPFVSRDNQFLFFAKDGVTHWMEAADIFITGIEKHPEPGLSMMLYQNFPNPFRGVTTIVYSLLQPGRVSLRIYNLLEKEVAVLVNDNRPAGSHSVSFDAGDLPSGIYKYELKTQNSLLTRKMVCVE